MRKENKKRIARVFAVLATTLTIALTICLPMSAMGAISTPGTAWTTQGRVILGYEYHLETQYTFLSRTSEEGNPWLPQSVNKVGLVDLELSRPFLFEADGTPSNGTDTIYGEIAYNDMVLTMRAQYYQSYFNMDWFTNEYNEDEQVMINATDKGVTAIPVYSIKGFDYITFNVRMKDIYSWGVGGSTAYSQFLELKIPKASIVYDIYPETINGVIQTTTKPMIHVSNSEVNYRPLEDYESVRTTDANYTITYDSEDNMIITLLPPSVNNSNSDTVYETENYQITITARVLRGLGEIPVNYELYYTTRTDINDLRYHMIEETRYKLPPIVDLTEWLGESVSAFMNFQLVEGITLGGVFTVLIGFSVVMWLLKMFAGG